MTTSLNSAQSIEKYLLQELPTDEKLLMDANRILDPALNENINWQNKTYHLVRLHGRRQLRTEIEAVHKKLFTDPAYKIFRRKIFQLFKNPR